MAVKSVLFLTAAVLLVAFPEGLMGQIGGSLDRDNFLSTLKIVKKTCYCPRVRSEAVAKKFMDCYDQAPGKQQFFTCQRETFDGRLFDTVANIRSNCAQPLRIPAYASCIEREMNKAGIDQNDAIRKLNACQLKVLG